MHTFSKFETAELLKFAGFPQPKPAVHQFWYGLINNNNLEPIILLKEGEGGEWYTDQFNNYHAVETFEQFGVYAPSAIDILQELGDLYSLSFVGKWCLAESKDRPPRFMDFDEEPAELCAEAFFLKTQAC
jgi:hypothetical protein